MPCLKHFFNPDFDYQNLKPVEKTDGSVDYYNMGYVQSVITGQVLAQWEDEENEKSCAIGHRYYPEKITRRPEYHCQSRQPGTTHSYPKRLCFL